MKQIATTLKEATATILILAIIVLCFLAIMDTLTPVAAHASVCKNIYRGRTPVCVKRTPPPMNGSALVQREAKRTNQGPLINR